MDFFRFHFRYQPETKTVTFLTYLEVTELMIRRRQVIESMGFISINYDYKSIMSVMTFSLENAITVGLTVVCSIDSVIYLRDTSE